MTNKQRQKRIEITKYWIERFTNDYNDAAIAENYGHEDAGIQRLLKLQAASMVESLEEELRQLQADGKDEI